MMTVIVETSPSDSAPGYRSGMWRPNSHRDQDTRPKNPILMSTLTRHAWTDQMKSP